MTIWYKQGVYGDLTAETSEGLRQVEKLYAEMGKDVYVTSIRDGSHMAGSFHPHGRAWDMRKLGVFIADIRRVLARGFDVVGHSRHYHIEYDPKD